MYRTCIALFALVIVAADFPKPKVAEDSTPYPALRITKLEFDQPRPLRGWAVRIDVTNPDVEFVVTPKTAVEPGFTTKCSTTLAFAEAEGVQAAINGSPFSPFRVKAGEPMKIDGLHLSRGELIANVDKKTCGALLIGAGNQQLIRHYPLKADELASARHGLGGFHVVIENGKNRMAENDTPDAKKHPRTAVGTSDDGKYMWWLVVDGRQAGKSEGLTYRELGDWALSLGITELLNLDGGGSTTFVMQDPTTHKHAVVNTPVGTGPPGSLRQNGNNLGVPHISGTGRFDGTQLQAIMPHLKAERVPLFLGPLNRAMAKSHIDNPARKAAFLAQLAHESGELKYMEEIASGEAYEGRKSLGNTEAGDGKRYKGRGPIQLTGRNNYRKAGAALGVELEEHPEKAADPEIGCQVAGWFWETHGLNKLADDGDFRQITRRINGGYNGQDRREKFYTKACEVFSVKR